MKRLFNLTQLQYNLFEIISVLLYTIVSFCVMYGMYYLVITVLLKHESTALFFFISRRIISQSFNRYLGIFNFQNVFSASTHNLSVICVGYYFSFKFI